MTGVLLGLILIPVLFCLGVGIAALPLHLTVKFFGVQGSSFGKAVQVTVMAWLASLGIAIVLGLIGLVIPLLPHLVAMVAPFAVFILLIQNSYEVNLTEAVIIGVIQVVIGFALTIGIILAVLVPLGIGATLLHSVTN